MLVIIERQLLDFCHDCSNLFFSSVETSKSSSASSPFMAPPLTDAKTLERDKDSMRARMELMILRAQKEICSALEKEEEVRYNSFRVDRG